jgi:ABC-type phosphate/phosphonate transport system substrate-binding protein
MTTRRAVFGLGTLAAAVALFAGLAGAAQAQSTDPSFRLNNRSNQTIMELYANSSQVSDWGRDHLGENVLPPGQSFIVRLPDGQCVNDIRIVIEGGQNIDRMQINTCNLTDINYP